MNRGYRNPDEKRFMVRSSHERVDVWNSALDVTGDDKHEVLQDMMKEYVLDVIRSDSTGFIPSDDVIGRINKIFS
jgi:hypothetical protein